MDNILTVSHLTKCYGSRRAVDDVSFALPRGSVFALLGSNGAGKTTAVRCMCGLLPPDQGEIRIQTAAGASAPEQCREMFGLSPQENAVGGQLTVEENLRLMGHLYGTTDTEARLEEMLVTFGLEKERRTKGKALSGGMGRRLSIAMALFSRPQILFLDEPTLGLDVLSRRSLWQTIRALEGQTTILLTTHYLEEAQALAHQIALMKEGKIIVQGTMDQLRAAAGMPDASLEDIFVRYMEGGTP